MHMEVIERTLPSIAEESSLASIRFQWPPANQCEFSPNCLRRTVVKINEPVLMISSWLSLKSQRLGIRTDFLEQEELSGLVLLSFLVIARSI